MESFHNLLLIKLLIWEDEYIIVSDVPGLGVEPNEDVACAHPYNGHKPHLKMGQYPYNFRTDRGFGGR